MNSKLRVKIVKWLVKKSWLESKRKSGQTKFRNVCPVIAARFGSKSYGFMHGASGFSTWGAIAPRPLR